MARSVPRASKALNTLDVRTLPAWRTWLVSHYDSVSEVWLVFQKRHTGRTSIAYLDALDEALCFGWIDSLVKRLDDERYARKFTPRKPDSRWSAINRRRYAALKASGRLMPPGLKRPPTDRHYEPHRPTPPRVPGYIREAIKKRPAAWKYFVALAPSHRRMYIGWIDSAKQHATKERRLHQALDLLAAGRRLGLK